MSMQPPAFRAVGNRDHEAGESPARDWDDFLGIGTGSPPGALDGLDGLVHSLDYSFQDATAAPLVHDQHLAPWRALAQPALSATHGLAKTAHVLMPSALFHHVRNSQTPYASGVGADHQHQLQLYRYQQQQQQQQLVHRVLLHSNCHQSRQQRSHKRRPEFLLATPPPQQPHSHHALPLADAPLSSDAADRSTVYASAPSAKPTATATSAATSTTTHVGRWTKKEHELFLEGLQLYGRSWKKISSLVVTRTLVQIRTHAQKYLQKQSRAAQKLAVASDSEATARSSSASSRPSSSPPPQRGSPAGAAASQREPHAHAHATIDPYLVLSTPTSQPPDASWRLSPLREHAFLPVAFPASMSSAAPSSAALAPPPSLALSGSSSSSSSPSPSSSSVSSSPSSDAHLVSSFRLDQLLQDESATACDDGEQRSTQRILAPTAPMSQECAKASPKSTQRRNSGFPHVLTDHELLHTFDHECASSLMPSPSLSSPAIADTPQIGEFGGYCDWM